MEVGLSITGIHYIWCIQKMIIHSSCMEVYTWCINTQGYCYCNSAAHYSLASLLAWIVMSTRGMQHTQSSIHTSLLVLTLSSLVVRLVLASASLVRSSYKKITHQSYSTKYELLPCTVQRLKFGSLTINIYLICQTLFCDVGSLHTVCCTHPKKSGKGHQS